jgi:hypothetical protein
MHTRVWGRGRVGSGFVLIGVAVGLVGVAAAEGPEGPVLLAQATKRAKARPKGAMTPKADAGAAKKSDTAAGDGSGPVFSKDIAPIFVGNCIECHNPEKRRGKFDLTTFQKLMVGADKEKVIVPGKPAESPLLQHLKGEVEPKMPPGNRELAQEAIGKIEAWVKAGALLDAGVDPTANLRTIAPTGEDLRRAALTKLAPQERDKKLEAVALERWTKASPKTKPDMTSGTAFLLFSTLPKDRAQRAVRTLDSQVMQLKRLLGPSAAPVLNSPEKISVYVFNDFGSFAEFSRGVENREVERGDQAHANLTVESPYLAAADPLAGHAEENTRKRPSRSKRGGGSDETDGPERTLDGLLVEQLAAGATAQAGKAPRWLSLGLGAYFAARVEPRSPYYRHLREQAAQEYKLGWLTKAQEALGDETSPEKVRAVGFSLVEWLNSTQRAKFPLFARGMLDGPQKLDDGIKELWDETRAGFLNDWGAWVVASYGASR